MCESYNEVIVITISGSGEAICGIYWTRVEPQISAGRCSGKAVHYFGTDFSMWDLDSGAVAIVAALPFFKAHVGAVGG